MIEASPTSPWQFNLAHRAASFSNFFWATCWGKETTNEVFAERKEAV